MINNKKTFIIVQKKKEINLSFVFFTFMDRPIEQQEQKKCTNGRGEPSYNLFISLLIEKIYLKIRSINSYHKATKSRDGRKTLQVTFLIKSQR